MAYPCLSDLFSIYSILTPGGASGKTNRTRVLLGIAWC